MSNRHSYGGPSDANVVLNPVPPAASSSRNMGGISKGRSKTNSGVAGGGVGVHNQQRHSMTSSLPSNSAPQQLHHQPMAQNYHHQRLPGQYSHEDLVVENIPNSTTQNNNAHPSKSQHISSIIHQHDYPPPASNNQRKSKPPRSSHEIISIDSDPEDATKNAQHLNSSLPPPGPSLAGPASKNRSLLGHHYDPIRPNRASASNSPSISSLIDPQPPPQHTLRKTAEKTSPPIVKPAIDSPPFTAPVDTQSLPAPSNVMEKPANHTAKEPLANRSPKPPKARRAGPTSAAGSSIPASSGNGLLSGIDILGADNTEKIEVPTIYLHVPLNGETNKYVNFAKLAEEKYGLVAVNPRLARERMRLADMSGDEMMMDGSESESMEDKVMSGLDGDSTTDLKAKRKPKRKLQDNYDSHDPFIDDSELLYEAQAAVAGDGFFVYSGPLIPQGEKVTVERADGTIKRARGGGRARGTARGGAPKPPAAPRKRLTKKAKEKLEKEKEEREKLLALAAQQKAVPYAA